MSQVVRTVGLRMVHGRKEILRGVDLEVRRGEILALLGPNGAGKTTTMEVLEGLRKRTSGEVTVLGRDPDKVDDSWRSRIGIVLQSWQDHRDWRVSDLVTHMAYYHDRPASRTHLLEQCGLDEFWDQRIHTLSGGQRRRMDLALALVGNPELLFLDEPTTGLDPQARRQFHDLVEQTAEQGITTLFTTHDLHEADRLAHRIAILANGTITFIGTGDDLVARSGKGGTVRWTEDGQVKQAETEDPSAFVVGLQKRLGGYLPGLEVRRRTLEDCYLDHIDTLGEETTA